MLASLFEDALEPTWRRPRSRSTRYGPLWAALVEDLPAGSATVQERDGSEAMTGKPSPPIRSSREVTLEMPRDLGGPLGRTIHPEDQPMKIKDKKNRSPKLLYDRLTSTLAKGRSEDESKIKFESFSTFFEIEEYEELLGSAFAFDPKISEHDRVLIVKRALGDFLPKRGSERMYSAFKAKVEEYAAEHIGGARRNFLVLANLSINGAGRIGTRRISGIESMPTASISLSQGRPQSTREKELKEFDALVNRLGVDRPGNWWFAQIRLAALSEWGALQDGKLCLDLIRGIWNMHVNPYSIKTLIGNELPINRILAGPIVTVHDEKGNLVPEANHAYFFRSNQRGCPLETVRGAFGLERGIRLRLRKISYAKEIVDGIVWLARALDCLEYDQLFLNLWSVLEYLVGTAEERLRQEDIVKRAVALSSDREYDLEVVNAAREFRNGFAHKFYAIAEGQKVAFGLKRIVERVLYYHIREGRKFESGAVDLNAVHHAVTP